MDMSANSPEPAAADSAELRAKAVAALRAGDFGAAAALIERGDATLPELLENLRIYQVELEMQAEELRASRHDTEVALRRFSGLFSALPVAVLVIDGRGMVLDANEHAQNTFALRRTRMIQHFFHRLVSGEDYRRRVVDALTRARLTGTATMEHIWFDANGRPFVGDLHLACPPAADVAQVQTICVIVDRTESLRAVAALRESQQRYESLVSSIDGIVWEADLSCEHFAFVGGQVERLLGHGVLAWREHGFWRRQLHDEDRARVLSERAAAVQRGDNHRIEYRMLRPDGSAVWLNDVATVVGERGQPRLLRGVMFDVSARREAEHLRLAKQSAEAASQAKTEFLSRVSHELRTPLNAILGFAQILSADGQHPLDAHQQQRVAYIEQAGWHLVTLINDILDLSRIEQGQLTLALAEVPLAAVLAESIDMVRTQAATRQVELQADLHAPAVSVRADPTRLKQVLINLLSNAVKYNTTQGTVAIRCRVEVDCVAIAVIDTGIGLDHEQLAKLYQPFNRLGADKTSIEGSGIGLVVTKRLVDLMHGTLEVVSAPGAGSTFTVRLPRA
jgi:PAS domain S-box-containing protein